MRKFIRTVNQELIQYLWVQTNVYNIYSISVSNVVSIFIIW